MNSNLTEKFIDLILELSNQNFSADVIHQTQNCLIDYISACASGRKLICEKIENYFALIPNFSAGVAPIGFKTKVDIAQAILINGLTSHIAEYDDGVRYGALHPGSPIFSALITLAQVHQTSDEDICRAAIVGYEVAIRLAAAIQPSHYELGYHPTATCGCLGATAAIANLLKFNRKEFTDALAAAAISASGSLKVIENSSHLKPYNAGRAAMIAYTSAMLAKAGFAGPDKVLEGNSGFFAMMSTQCNTQILLRDSSDALCISQVYFKPYASCRHTHPAIEACIYLKNKYQFSISQIRKVNIYTYSGVLGKHDFKNVVSISSAKMSIPFCACLALEYGCADEKCFNDESIEMTPLRELCNKTDIIGDSLISSWVPDKRAARVTVELYSGEVLEHQVDYPKGEPENPMTEQERQNKFFNLFSHSGISSSISEKLFSTLSQFPHQKSVAHSDFSLS